MYRVPNATKRLHEHKHQQYLKQFTLELLLGEGEVHPGQVASFLFGLKYIHFYALFLYSGTSFMALVMF